MGLPAAEVGWVQPHFLIGSVMLKDGASAVTADEQGKGMLARIMAAAGEPRLLVKGLVESAASIWQKKKND